MNSTLVISTNPPPFINIPLSKQLPSFGMFSAPSTILYHPSTSFEIYFAPDTFYENGSPSVLNYYSVSVGNTPLPSWIQFDDSSLSFSGQTPDYQSLIQPPQTFGVQLIASDVEGFTGASITFELEIGVHLLAFKNAQMVINATAGEDINFDGIADNLEVDGLVVNLSSIASITAQTPSWLMFDNSTLTLSGTVPADVVPSNVTVQVTDIYGDNASATVVIAIAAIFDSSIANINITAGSHFSYDLTSYVRSESDIAMTAQFSPMTSWITFDPQTFTVSGQVPTSALSSKISVTLVATSKSTHASASQSFTVFVLASSSAPGSHPPTSATTGMSLSATSTSSSVQSYKSLSNGAIAALVIPLGLLFLALILTFHCYRQRRRAARKRPRSPTKSQISAPLEAPSSVVEIIKPAQIVLPEPLQPETSIFSTEYSSSTYTNERKWRNINPADNPLSRSQTMAAVSGPQKAELAQFDSSGARAYSDNVLSKTDRSRRSSAHTTIASSSRTNYSYRSSRRYSNYSRKGHIRRSGRIRSTDRALRDGTFPISRPQSTILNLQDSNFSVIPIENFSALSKRTSVPKVPEFPYPPGDRLQDTKPANRKSRFFPGVDRRSGIGYGGRESIADLADPQEKRDGVGRGKIWEPVSIPRESRTSLNINLTTAQEQNRLSNVSNITENTDLLDSDQVAPLSIGKVTKDPIPPSPACPSNSSVASRPVSRRAVGSSPFFAGGGSTRSSRKLNARTSYADSPTVPEETILGAVDTPTISDAREGSTTPRDSFGISYGSARDGTRQLRSYIQSRLGRVRTNSSMKSNDSKDSRFGSANSLRQPQPNIIIHSRSPADGRAEAEAGAEAEDEYEDYLPDDRSEGSWESVHTVHRDSLGNIIEYGLGEPAELGVAIAQRHTLAPSTALRSHPTSPMPPRIVSGKGKRPTSVDAGANKGSETAIVESDHAAYI